MYKVLVVDDDLLVREGISTIVDWPSIGAELVGAAENGVQAFERIEEHSPDIVITDLEMPGMDGLELTRRTKERFPETTVVILSGHGEFGYAREAMQLGVRHYLLKPSGEEEICRVLREIMQEKEWKRGKENFLEKIRRNLEKVMPEVREQFLKDYVSGRVYSAHDLSFYSDYLNIAEGQVSALLLKMEAPPEYEKLFALKRMAEEMMRNEGPVVAAIIGETVLLVAQSQLFQQMAAWLTRIKDVFFNYYSIDVTIAVSGSGSFRNLPELYREAQDVLTYRFYLGEGSIITREDVRRRWSPSDVPLAMDVDKIAGVVKSGNRGQTERELDAYFLKLRGADCDIHPAKTYCLELFSAIVRQSPPEQMASQMKRMSEFERADTLEHIAALIRSVAGTIANANFEQTSRKHGAVLDSVIRCVEQHLHREELSLTWIAKEMMYMNEDYLGKLFKKELGEKFSQYVQRIRMEKAKRLLAETDLKTYEIAERIGLGKYPQYFSQAFKKHTGVSPTEFRTGTAVQ